MKVSVAMITYNHERFIAKALDSILMQRTDVDYEIVVGEDCSTDNTREILVSYQKRHPEKFKLLLHEKNLGAYLNAKQTFEACTGEYIAILDGDDYWTCPDKMQKQVDFLDSHPDFAICFNDSLIVYEDQSREPTSYRPHQKKRSTIEDILLDNYIPTSSVMYRRGLYGELPEWFSTLRIGDWPLHVLNALHGDIGYLDETMSVYLVHGGGVWSLRDRNFHELTLIGLFETLDRHLDRKYARIINRFLRWKYLWISEAYEGQGDMENAGTFAVKALTRHLNMLGHPFQNRLDAGLAADMPDYMKEIGTRKLVDRWLRLVAVPYFKPYAIAVLKPIAPRLYHYLREKAVKKFGV